MEDTPENVWAPASGRLRGRGAVVTGAGRGLGRAIAWAFAREGASVVVADISGEEHETAQLIQREGGRAAPARVDVTRRQDVQTLAARAVETCGRVDILVNNAGVIVNKPFLEISEEEWEWQFDVITKGTYLCSQEIARVMAQRADGGRIINISSSGGRRPLAEESAYCAAKASVLMLTRVMALELAPYGITANAVCPGMIDTEMLDKAFREIARRRGVSAEAVKRAELLGVPLRRLGRPVDVAEACVYLASDAAAYVTGACIDITGGWMLP